jgi:predicted nucleotidyltransferase
MDRTDASREISLKELREIVAPIAIDHGIICVYLFGSRARGDNHKDSDFDFCIVIPKEYDLFDIGSFQYDLKEALGTDVNLVWEDNVVKKPLLMEEILRDRKIVFEA